MSMKRTVAEKKPAVVKKPNAIAVSSATQTSEPYLASVRKR